MDSLTDEGWRDYNIIPMGSNLQIVFYHNPASDNPDDILVKALINEREVRMPGTPVYGPYYRWEDIRSHYLRKLSDFQDKQTAYRQTEEL